MIHPACLWVGAGPTPPGLALPTLRWARAEMGCASLTTLQSGVPATTLPLVTEVPEPRRLLCQLL